MSAPAYRPLAGFEHFIDFFRAPNAFRVLRNTVAIALLKLAFIKGLTLGALKG